MKSLLFLADGFEEIEALTVVDVMRRAGMTVSTVSINTTPRVTGANGIVVEADEVISKIDPAESSDIEWMIAPGGMPGASNLAACGPVTDMLLSQSRKGGNIAAICAAPAVVLAPLGLLRGRDATCYPSFKDDLKKYGANYVGGRVVALDNIITSNGPSSALEFAFAIVAASLGDDTASSIASAMLV